MTGLAKKSHVKKIERIVEHLCENWINKEIDQLSQYFHSHVVMMESGTNRRITGIEQVIERYRDFIEETEVSDFKITELFVELFESTAIAWLCYHMRYSVESTSYDEDNTDILVFRAHEKGWQIVWRTQMIGT